MPEKTQAVPGFRCRAFHSQGSADELRRCGVRPPTALSGRPHFRAMFFEPQSLWEAAFSDQAMEIHPHEFGADPSLMSWVFGWRVGPRSRRLEDQPAHLFGAPELHASL